MKETKIAIPIRTSDCGRYCADCRWCWWGGHWEDPGCAVLSDEHGKRLPLEMSDHGPERPTACLAAEQQAQGDAEGLRAALRSAARDLQTANQWSWEARWPADRIRWFAERSEVCRAAAKAGRPPKRPATAEDCPGEAPCESCGLPEDRHNPIVGSAGPCREYAPAAGAKDCLGSGENEQGGGEWVAWTPERRPLAVKDWARSLPHGVFGRVRGVEDFGPDPAGTVCLSVTGDWLTMCDACGGAPFTADLLDLWQSPDGAPPPGVEE